jgi:hypothetical protein
MDKSFHMPPEDAFMELPGMRGLRMARVGQGEGKTLDVIDAVKGVVIPVLHNVGGERGRVLWGKLRLVIGSETLELGEGETWEVPAGVEQGPHVVMEDARVVVLREGASGFDA